MVFTAFSVLFTFSFFIISSYEPYIKTKNVIVAKSGEAEAPQPPCSALPACYPNMQHWKPILTIDISSLIIGTGISHQNHVG